VNEPDRERLYGTIAGVLGISAGALSEESGPETTTNWNSLNHLNVILALESEFGVSFTAAETLQLRSMRAISQWFRSHNGRP
jgi:acyl carrier protein